MLQRLWSDIPLLTYVLYAAAIAHAELVNLDPPRPGYVWGLVFPLTVPAFIYLLRWRTAGAGERRLSLAILVTAPLLTGLGWWSGIHYPIAPENLRDIYEAGTIANLLVVLVHAAGLQRGLFWLLVGPVAFYGLLLENGGILLGFFAELNYRLYLGPLPAPLATMSGWVIVFYLVLWVNWEVRRLLPGFASRPFLAAGLAALAGLLLDLQVDPFATAIGLWYWNPLLQDGFLGVPTLNFVAWFCAIYPFAWLLVRREQAEALAPLEIAQRRHRRWLLLRVPLVLALAAVMFCCSMLLIEGGISGPTFTILHDSAVSAKVIPRE